ncbi:MAG: hypothetical protein RLY57_618, partial [Candidatus Parcubacteria bacterium]
MNPDNQKAITQQIESLPEEIKALILGDEWKHWVGNIVKKNTLNLDQASSQPLHLVVLSVVHTHQPL